MKIKKQCEEGGGWGREGYGVWMFGKRGVGDKAVVGDGKMKCGVFGFGVERLI